ncbi:hypothetical protein [Paraburkholderia diazotrophica]|uniref:hypothetical protein n=1 Tax=Paraburkholderia diazotrophica TaxID=667676 RepID=UPI00316D33E7
MKMPKNVKKKVGRKPASAYVAEECARQNIVSKLELLQKIIDYCGKDEKELGRLTTLVSSAPTLVLPVSLRQFHNWCDTRVVNSFVDEVPVIRRIGNGTLSKNAELRTKADKLLAVIADMLRRASSSEQASDEERTSRELKKARKHVKTLEDALISLRLQINGVTRERDTIERKYETLKKNFRRELDLAMKEEVGARAANISNLRPKSRSQ